MRTPPSSLTTQVLAADLASTLDDARAGAAAAAPTAALDAEVLSDTIFDAVEQLTSGSPLIDTWTPSTTGLTDVPNPDCGYMDRVDFSPRTPSQPQTHQPGLVPLMDTWIPLPPSGLTDIPEPDCDYMDCTDFFPRIDSRARTYQPGPGLVEAW